MTRMAGRQLPKLRKVPVAELLMTKVGVATRHRSRCDPRAILATADRDSRATKRRCGKKLCQVSGPFRLSLSLFGRDDHGCRSTAPGNRLGSFVPCSRDEFAQARLRLG